METLIDRLFFSFKQIWKHKGEEFRLHGQWGWRWLSATRPLRKLDARQCGLRAGPWRIVTCSNGNLNFLNVNFRPFFIEISISR